MLWQQMRSGGIRAAVEQQVALKRQAVIGALKCLYWLVREEPWRQYYHPVAFFSCGKHCILFESFTVTFDLLLLWMFQCYKKQGSTKKYKSVMPLCEECASSKPQVYKYPLNKAATAKED